MNEDDTTSIVGARGLSFENRIAISSLVTAVVVLIAATGLFMLEQWQAEQRDLHRNQATITSVIAGELAPKVSQNDAAAVRAVLAPLVAKPEIRAADVLDSTGRTMVHIVEPAGTGQASNVIYFETREPIAIDGRRVGDLVVTSRAISLWSILPRYLAVCAALFFATAGLALFMGRWLAGLVIEPVNRLSQAMRDVTDSADYAQRVPTWAQDEFGLLTESFNTLLAQLHANDGALHRAMIELVEARDAAQAANVLKSQFLANMSHEIRTPLNGVLAMAQIIALGDLPQVQRERVEVIRRSGEDLLAVLNDVLDISKIEAGKLEIETGEVDPDALVRNAHLMFDAIASAKKNLTFDVQLRPSATGLRRGDQARIGQILNNLVSNALKFTSEGHVQVIVDGHGENGDSGLRLTVTDTGLGIPAEKLSILFEKFTQADNSNTRRFGGTGLGLALCRELAQMMRGDIAVQSVEGEGSTFTVTLPLARIAETVAGAEPAPTVAEIEDRPLRVLAAEDIPTNQLVLRTVMESFGVDLTMVDNGREAVEAWNTGNFDLILMDIQMPEMDGVEATLAIRAAERQTGRARTPIIAVSANAMTHHVKRYREVGMDGHVAKPIELVKLHSAMETALTAAAAEQADDQTQVA
jgi:signal transduction histidine kinase/AmiR/NasT family two-component response regulator